MKKSYRLLLALGIATASLSSCSRASYSFNPAAPAYLGSEHVRPTAAQAAPAVASAAQVTAPVASVIVAQKAAAVGVVAPAAKWARPLQVQRILLKKVTKQLAKIQVNRQNTAHLEHTASKTGRSALVALAGVALIAIGGAIGTGFGGLLVLIGLIAFLVGIVLLVVHLVSGD